MEQNKNFNPEAGRIVGGIIAVAVGVVLLMRNMGYYLPDWLLRWPMILIALGIYNGFKYNFRNNSWIILLAVGGFFLLDDIIPQLEIQETFWPVIIIIVGLIYVFGPRKLNFNRSFTDSGTGQLQAVETVDGKLAAVGTMDTDGSNFVKIDSIFSGVKRSILSKNFGGGKVSCVFGGVELNFLKADIQGVVVLKLDVVFGGAKLIVPGNWTIQNEIDGAFHGVDDNRMFSASVSMDPSKVLILKGSAVFGGIDVKSY